MSTPTPAVYSDDDINIFSLEHQMYLLNVCGAHTTWAYEYPNNITLTGLSTLRCDAQILGTVNSGRWRWAWSDPRLPSSASRSAHTVRETSTDPRMLQPVVALDGVRDAERLAALTKPLTGRWTTFAFTPRPGWTVYAALSHPLLVLPEPNELTTAQTLAAAVEVVTNIHHAVDAYASLRGLHALHSADTVAVGRDGWRVTVHAGTPRPTVHVESPS